MTQVTTGDNQTQDGQAEMILPAEGDIERFPSQGKMKRGDHVFYRISKQLVEGYNDNPPHKTVLKYWWRGPDADVLVPAIVGRVHRGAQYVSLVIMNLPDQKPPGVRDNEGSGWRVRVKYKHLERWDTRQMGPIDHRAEDWERVKGTLVEMLDQLFPSKPAPAQERAEAGEPVAP